jgi:hypothetical protein
MFGVNIDYLAVDLYDGSSWSSNVWNRSGAQHDSNDAAWSNAVVDLSTYVGNDDVTIRFRAKELYWHTADIAIDNIRVAEPPPTLPYAESFEEGFGIWQQSYEDDIDWTRYSGYTPTGAEVTNTGPSSASAGDYYLYVENHDSGVQYKAAWLEGTLDLSTVSNATLCFDYHMYGAYIDYLAVDVYDGSTWSSNVWNKTNAQHASCEDAWSTAIVDLTEYAGLDEVTIRFRSKQKQWHAADTAIDNIRVTEVQALPYAESFEDGFGAWVQSAVDDYDWTRNSGGTDTAAAGPSGASDGSYYLYAEGHHGLGSYKTSVVYCAFNFSTVSAPELTFDYHMYGTYIDFLSIDIHDGSTWSSNVWTKSGPQQSSSDDAWLTALVDLSAFAGNDEVTIRFRTANTLWNAADPAIDNIRVEEAVTAYDIWATTAFSGAPGGTDMTATGNPDGDRFTNLQEWALVLDPLVVDKPSMDVSMDDSDFTVVYSRRDSDDVAVYASWATTPTATVWRVAGDGMTEASVTTSNDVETMSATVPMDEGQKFIRLQVEE